MKRSCGHCTLCCKVLPVEELQKLASHRCQHQRMGKGCAIYARRPMSCMFWNCEWLATEADLPRPDRAGYVIDIMPDMVRARDDLSGQVSKIIVRQIWLDPAHPDAWKDCTKLKAWMDAEGRKGIAFLFRRGSYEAFTMIPPNMTSTGQWAIVGSKADGSNTPNVTNVMCEAEWGYADVAEEMARQGMKVEMKLA